ncbi:acetate kinase [Paludicola sp. MB14-C6]|uniref:acetate/propionate family kinase n=1 Tax=Paludihabitans sp. MB14-C6 TaxID=3070656 RepID=UPI0027DD0B0D|nr:acetate kinase [Paludicola sp. MB14-C6]WMJ22474.1 acetate kinase [Paludicola sp. MB14-C6]
MKILVINAGSSSLKYQLIDMEDEHVIAKGNCDRIGIDGGCITHKLANGKVITEDCQFNDHADAFKKLVEVLTKGCDAVVKNLNEITAIGHRIVQGAEHFSESVLATDEVVQKIEDISDLAPLHNPGHVQAIRACKKVFGPDVPEVVVFDTAFHQTMPPKAYMFGTPYEYYEKYNVRKYGFHGTSHRFVSNKLAKCLGRDLKDLKVITCHLGNGSSIAAIDHGKCVDTSMGFTPLDGILMGTRSGCIDASAVLYIMENEKLTASEMNMILNKQSGYLGVSGITSDDRDLRKAAAEGNKRAKLAGEMQRYHIKKYIGAYAAAMGGLDAIVFTGGIGENSASLREEVCDHMQFLGIELDTDKNIMCNAQEVEVSMPYSKVKVWIIPTNEELLIARDTKEIVEKIR